MDQLLFPTNFPKNTKLPNKIKFINYFKFKKKGDGKPRLDVFHTEVNSDYWSQLTHVTDFYLGTLMEYKEV